jgi:membrane protease YdiL (CAAX protease family)
LQTTILEFVPGSEQIRTVIAIVASNSLYGLVYAQISARDSLFMCILGIFWGYLYHRQKNIIGVSVSHFLIKSWMFCLGLSSLSI